MNEVLVREIQSQKALTKEHMGAVMDIGSRLQKELDQVRSEFNAKKIDRNQVITRLRNLMGSSIRTGRAIHQTVAKSLEVRQSIWEGERSYNATDAVDFCETTALVAPEVLMQLNMAVMTISNFASTYIEEIRIHVREIQKGNLK